MKKWLIILLLVGLLPISVSGIALYGNYTYGNGVYGQNTPPTILAFAPATLNLGGVPTLNETFNITFTDYDGDTVVLEWYLDNVFNQTGGNFSVYFPVEGDFNVTGNVTDEWNETSQVSWILEIRFIQIVGNITDNLIAPSVVQDGQLFIIKANLTAVGVNLTSVTAYLNLNNQFTLLSETPQNRSIGNVWSTNSTEVSWIVSAPFSPGAFPINVTYFTENGTNNGTNKNVVVDKERELMGLAVVFTVIITILFYFFLIRLLTLDIYEEHGAIKLFLVLLVLWLWLIPVNIALESQVFTSGSQDIISNLELFYSILIWVNYFITFYIVLWFIVSLIKKMQAVVKNR